MIPGYDGVVAEGDLVSSDAVRNPEFMESQIDKVQAQKIGRGTLESFFGGSRRNTKGELTKGLDPNAFTRRLGERLAYLNSLRSDELDRKAA